MKCILHFLFYAALFSATCIPTLHAQTDSLLFAEVKTAIDAGNKQWIASYEHNNPEGIVSLFAADGCMLGSGGKVTKGAAAISERVNRLMAYFGKDVTVKVKTLKLWLVDLTAYETGEYSYTSTHDGKSTINSGYYTTIWKKQQDGSWKISIDMAVN
jgi:uncharacterized protein (TIGR02246 family)